MKDKERLGKVKKNAIDYYDNITLNQKDSTWLIEQAERVQELENVLEQDARQGVLEGLYEQNKRYREAIEKTRYAIHTQISSINHQENTELENQYIRGITFSSDMINRYFSELEESE